MKADKHHPPDNLCLETLCIQSGEISNLEFHDARFNAVRKTLFLELKPLSLKNLIEIPDTLSSAKMYRCRVSYRNTVESVEFIPYNEKLIKKINLDLTIVQIL